MRSKISGEDKLTARQRTFILEYLSNGGNGTQAALLAGYSKKAASVASARLLKHPIVARVVKALQKDHMGEKRLERQSILEKLANALHRDLRDLCDAQGFVISKLTDIPQRAHCYIDGFEVTQMFNGEGEVVGQKIKVKLTSNASVLDMAMKHVGAYAEEKHAVKHSLDWDDLFGDLPSNRASDVEAEITKAAQS